MSYHALYRAHRPQQFSDVVGQVHIVRTIQNALKHERLSHAYLFCGPRGTGKTSIAKIIAKAVNCVNYPTSEPCNECPNCIGITKGSVSDVFEIDAASNNGVDEIREIRDKVKYAPTMGRYKVYIIDEVHMLSTGAFNALLKTLEEPPKHVIFILATTEPHKIPATIISRCQRFDFKQISSKEIEGHLVQILNQQELLFEPEAIELVAELADGGMRDALSLLDQVISYSMDKIEIDDVHALSGTISYAHLLNIINGIEVEDFASIVDIIQDMLDNGKEPTRIVDGLISVYRDILMYQKVGSNFSISNLLIAEPLFVTLTKGLKSDKMVQCLFKLNKLQNELRFSNHPELMLEVGLLSLTEEDVSKASGPTVNLSEIETLKSELLTLKKLVKQLEARPVQPARPLAIDEGQFKMPLFEEPKAEPRPYIPVNHPESVDDRVILPEYVTPEMLTIEQVLGKASKNAKDLVESKWAMLNPITMPEYKEVIVLLQDGTPVAASEDGFILTYKHEPGCKRLLRDDNKKTAQQLVDHLFDKHYSFMVLPESFWLEQRQVYIEQKKQGIEPKLKQYSQDIKNVINYSEEVQTKEDKLVSQAIDWYGADLVNIVDE
ncbi:MAG: DNA polymerase III subunit gamma/tau [Turicibacter sp.]